MEQKTYEIIIETLSDALEMERWRKEQAEKEARELKQRLEEAKQLIAELQKEKKDA